MVPACCLKDVKEIQMGNSGMAFLNDEKQNKTTKRGEWEKVRRESSKETEQKLGGDSSFSLLTILGT